MSFKALWKYFLDVNLFNIIFSFTIGFVMGWFWIFILFSSVGILIGLLGYNFIKKNEYYTYYNLGYTKQMLIKKVFLMNLTISTPLLLIYLIVMKWIF